MSVFIVVIDTDSVTHGGVTAACDGPTRPHQRHRRDGSLPVARC